MNEKALKRKSYLDKAKPNRNQNIGPKRQSSDRNVTHTRQDTLPHFLPQTKEENRKGECHPCMVSTGFDVSVSRLTFQGEDSTTPSDLGSITSKQMNEKASKRNKERVVTLTLPLNYFWMRNKFLTLACERILDKDGCAWT